MDTHGTDTHGTDTHGTDTHDTDTHSTDTHSMDNHGTDTHSTDTHGIQTSKIIFFWKLCTKWNQNCEREGKVKVILYFLRKYRSGNNYDKQCKQIYT